MSGTMGAGPVWHTLAHSTTVYRQRIPKAENEAREYTEDAIIAVLVDEWKGLLQPQTEPT